MPTKRQVVETLNRNELLALAEQHELEVADRRVRDQLTDAVAGSRKVVLADAFSEYSRERLKELCRELGLDDSGREKSLLIERLTGHGAKEVAAAPERVTKASGKAGPGLKAAAIVVAQGEKLTLAKLEGYLWSAADILRGSIDSSDYKGFIFGMLFLKRLSDRFDEECAALVAEGGDPEDRDEHQFWVAKSARWSEIQKTSMGVGEALNKACAALERDNGALEGVLAGIDFNDERKLGDARSRDVVLGKLAQHFAKVDLRNASLSEPDMLGRAYEYLIEKFADDAGKKGGEFYTPKKVVELIVELLAPDEGMRICDPTCGSGGMLIECANHLQRNGKNPRNLSLFGQEKNLGTWAICKMNMLLHSLPDARIEKGDTIRDPKLRDGEALMLFDRVIANPPFSLDEWGSEIAANDPWTRFRYGLPPKNMGDLAFVQHMIATLAADGVAGVVMPHGVLFRGSGDGRIRRGLVEDDLLETIVNLPENLFYGTPIPAVLLILNRRKSTERKGRILLINASDGYETIETRNFLRDADVRRIVELHRAFADAPHVARVVALSELEEHNFNLSIGRYVDSVDPEEDSDYRTALRELADAERIRQQLNADLHKQLSALGLSDDD